MPVKVFSTCHHFWDIMSLLTSCDVKINKYDEDFHHRGSKTDETAPYKGKPQGWSLHKQIVKASYPFPERKMAAGIFTQKKKKNLLSSSRNTTAL
jgi:hypothetical protein